MSMKIKKLSLKLDHKLSVGNIVWAKLGSHKWWPAIIIRSSDCGHPEAKFGNSWVFWFGDHKISEISRKRIVGFIPNFLQIFRDASGKKWKAAVYEALEIVAARCNHSFRNAKDLMSWAMKELKAYDETLIGSSNLPPLVLKCLKDIRKFNLDSLSYSNDSNTDDISTKKELIALNGVRNGSLNIEGICISCREDATIVDYHPFFTGGICFECKKRLQENIYAYGYDGKTMCCIICAKPGSLIICENVDCFRSHCCKCITNLVGIENQLRIMEMNPWQCFICSNVDYEGSLLKARKDWQERLFNFFQPIKTQMKEIFLPNCKIKKPIRVLSLFDGIGTGKLALDELRIEVEKYYACEIDNDAVNVSKFHFGDSITYIGNVKNLTEGKIQSICPIDLVIGGSPCNDLSLVNPERKGIYDFSGTGHLFFDFFHVLKSVQRLNKERCHEPALIDSKYVSPQTRPRYFWGNIPGMHMLYQYYSSLHNDVKLDVGYNKEKLLNHCLLEKLGRKGVVEKIRTVTTQKNSLIQDNCTLLPVEMNGEPDSLWVTELET
ncbi:hypothetical protein TNIN_462632 [Trichonephila inaurata madagascariensis]|uniref:DNA (cytosine-5-)-methyltransferase n=1 Tax=Trichonephila inaurata madagascariensis TaxID=2747483 RepID=A0A8X6XA86_9ARAC|nr:hypothetical protein TNIN_462632 [Trichonephila inaurata madagascariensis]